VDRWVDVEADDIARLRGTGGIVGELEQMEAIRLRVMRPPNSLHRDEAHSSEPNGRASELTDASWGSQFDI
jgi:hypothetical protein